MRGYCREIRDLFWKDKPGLTRFQPENCGVHKKHVAGLIIYDVLHEAFRNCFAFK